MNLVPSDKIIPPEICELIDKALRDEETTSKELSELIARERGIEISPHFISEYKFHKREDDFLR